MRFWSAALALCLCEPGCKSPPLPPAEPTASPPKAAAPAVAVDGPAFLLLATGQTQLQGSNEPVGLYVAGVIESGRFAPQGDVQGDGELAGEGEDGQPGWMELIDGSFYGAQTARAPTPPYVQGRMDAEGLFHPTSRRVVY